MPVNAKGSRRERQFLVFLTKKGYVAHRVAGSGHHDTAFCDIVAIKRGKPFLIEVKSRKKIYYPKGDEAQLEFLMKESKKCRATPILAVKLNYKPWQMINISKKVPKKVC